MSKYFNALKKTEMILTIGSVILGFVSTIVILTTYINQLKSGQMLLSQKLDEYVTRTENITLAMNRLESHVCSLDELHGKMCIAGGN